MTELAHTGGMIDHRDIESVLQHFDHSHLPAELAAVAAPFAALANTLRTTIRPCRELLKSLDALLVAKDAAVRAKRVSIQSTSVPVPPQAPVVVPWAPGVGVVGPTTRTAPFTPTGDPRFEAHMGATPFRTHLSRPQ